MEKPRDSLIIAKPQLELAFKYASQPSFIFPSTSLAFPQDGLAQSRHHWIE